METKLINLDNILAISCNLCNKRWNSAKGSCRKQRVYFCPIQPNTCSDLHYNSLKLFTCSQSKHFSNMAGNEQRWDGASPHSLSNFTILTHSVAVICLTHYQKIFFVTNVQTSIIYLSIIGASRSFDRTLNLILKND